MRILIVTQWFEPEPTFKGLVFARELVRAGHIVEVLTGFPNYPGGKVYPGYEVKLFQRETIDGISIIRVPLYPSHNSSRLGRVLNYATFAISAALLGPFFVKSADVAYVYHPPVTVALPAIVLKFVRGIPFVYDIMDLWPDTLSATGMVRNRSLLCWVGRWCNFVYACAAHICVVSEGFRRALEIRGVPLDKISVIYNWCDDSQLCSIPRDKELSQELGMADRFNVVFAGTMGKAQALDAVLAAAVIVSKKNPAVQFVFVGGGIDVERLKFKVREEEIPNVIFLPRRPVSEIASVLALADVLLVHLKDDPLFSITIPSKIQAYMVAERPILLAVQGDAANLLAQSGAGIVCKPEDPVSIAAAVEKFVSLPRDQQREMGRLGKLFYERELSLKVGVNRFEKIFRAVSREI